MKEIELLRLKIDGNFIVMVTKTNDLLFYKIIHNFNGVAITLKFHKLLNKQSIIDSLCNQLAANK